MKPRVKVVDVRNMDAIVRSERRKHGVTEDYHWSVFALDDFAPTELEDSGQEKTLEAAFSAGSKRLALRESGVLEIGRYQDFGPMVGQYTVLERYEKKVVGTSVTKRVPIE